MTTTFSKLVRKEKEEARRSACERRTQNRRRAKLSFLLCCALGLGALGFAGGALAADYEIDGTTGNTFADVFQKLDKNLTSTDRILVDGDQFTNAPGINAGKTKVFGLVSKDGTAVTITANTGNKLYYNSLNPLTVNGDGTVTLKGSGTTATDGGVFYRKGQFNELLRAQNVSIDGVNFDSNTAKSGGVFYQEYGNAVNFSNSSFTNNTASYQGGAVWINRMSGDLSVTNTVFDTNSAAGGAGGALYVGSNQPTTTEHSIYLTDVTFQNNSATRGGAVMVSSQYTPTVLSGTNLFKNNTATTNLQPEYGLGGGAILALSKIDMSGNNTFTGNSSITAGGAITSYGNVNISGIINVTNNTTAERGGGIYAEEPGEGLGVDVNFSGENVQATFTGNRVTDGVTTDVTRKYGNDIYASKNINITGTGTYTFEGGVWANQDLNITGSAESPIVLTTGNTAQANVVVGGWTLGTLSSNDKTTLSNVIFENSHLDTTDNVDVNNELSGILFGNFGVNLDNVTVQNNSVTADNDIAGVIYSNTGNAKTPDEEDYRYSTASGNSLYQGNSVNSTTGRGAGGAIDSMTYFFVGAKEGETGPNQVGNSNTVFDNNSAIGATEADGGGFATLRGLVMKSSNNTLSFTNNTSQSTNGVAYGGGIGVMSWYNYAGSDGFGVSMTGDNNNVTFTNNAATGATGYGGAISLRAYGTDRTSPSMVLDGDNSSYVFESNEATTAGGAVYSTGDVKIAADAAFVGNIAGENGGAIYVDTNSAVVGRNNAKVTSGDVPTYGATVTLMPGDGQTVVFDGNKAGEDNSSITFGDGEGVTTHGTYALNIAPEEGGTVLLSDPIKVNMVYDENANDKVFTLNVNGQGQTVWAGTNSIRTIGGQADVNFVSGDVLLLKDFNLVNDGGDMNVALTGGSDGVQLAADLNGRDNDLAMFENPTDFTTSGTVNFKVNSIRTFGDKETDRWLVTDSRANTTDTDFAVSSTSEKIEAGMVVDGDELWLEVTNNADEILAKNLDPNAKNVRKGVESVWDQLEPNLEDTIGVPQTEALFNDLVYNTQTYTAEGVVAQAFGALDHTSQVADQAYEFNRLGDEFESGCMAVRDVRLWGGYLGSQGELDSSDYKGFKQSWQGIMGGISKEGMGGNTVGGYFAYADGRNKLEDLNTRVKTDSYNGGVFGILRGANNVSLTADFAYGYYTNEAARENLAGRFVGDMNQNVFGTGLMLRRDFIRDNKILTPLVGARYQYLTQGRYDEEAEYGLSEFANSLDKFNANSLQSYVGATWSAGTQTAQGRIVNPMVYAVWRHEFMDKSYSTLGSYAGDIGQTFVINSIARERDLADLGGSLSVTNNCTTVGLGYNATLTKGYTEHNWYAGMSYRF